MQFSDTISVLGCGWLGLPLAKSLVEKGYEVRGSTRHPSKISKLRNGGITPYIIDLNPTSLNIPTFFSSNILIINLPPRNHGGDEKMYEKVLSFVRQSAIRNKVEKVIFISSTGVYLESNKQVTETDASYEGLSRAGISLLKMEEMFSKSSLTTTVIRFGGLYGPDRHPGNFLKQKENLPGASNPINMIHLDDCIGMIHYIIEHELWGEVFNGCSPNLPTREKFYQNAATELGVQPPIFSCQEKPYKKVSSKLIISHGYQFIH
ncbi:MAG: NAD(P)H-binding protein [Cyclobacteriaceae bacterium]